MDPSLDTSGTILTCTNEDCGCRLRIDEPCPHGDTYTLPADTPSTHCPTRRSPTSHDRVAT